MSCPDDVKLNPNWNQSLIEQVKRHFNYDPETGIFTSNVSKGKKVGHLSSTKYICLSISDTKLLKAHQVAFAIMKGFVPSAIDHIDLDRTNNKWSNLRIATPSQNQGNTTKQKNNKSGYKGVHWDNHKSSWMMSICKNRITYRSSHNTKEEAYAAYCTMAEKLQGEFANVQ